MNKKTTKVAKKTDKNSVGLSVHHQEFKGPIPPPVILEQYQKILPSAPERIISMAEKQQNHEHVVTSQALATEVMLVGRGQRYGFLIILLVLIFSAYALYLGNVISATISLIIASTPLVKIFVLGMANKQN